jgi:hypothetical protein
VTHTLNPATARTAHTVAAAAPAASFKRAYIYSTAWKYGLHSRLLNRKQKNFGPPDFSSGPTKTSAYSFFCHLNCNHWSIRSSCNGNSFRCEP